MARRSGTGTAGAGGSSSSGGSSSGSSSSGGGSSGGGSSGGGASSSSASRSSSPRGKGSSVTTKSSTGGTPQKTVSTISAPKRQTRTTTTVSAPAVTASQSYTKATGRPQNKTVTKPITVSPPVSQLTGGRIAQNPVTPQNQGRGNSLLSGTGTPVTVTFGGGQKQTMNLSNDAIRYYQNLGLKVSPVSTTFGGVNPMSSIFSGIFGEPTTNTYNASPQIVPIQNPSVAYDQNPPAQLHVDPNQVVKPNTRTNSNFGGLGANPWNLPEAIMGLFGMAPQEDPAKQWLPQIEDNTQSTGYPIYTAMAQGQYQDQAYAETQQGFNNQILGNTFDPSQTVKNLFQNKWVLYAGLAVGALVVLKIVMGMGGAKGGGGGTKIYT